MHIGDGQLEERYGITDRGFLLRRRKVIRKATVDILRNLRTQRDIHYALAHGKPLLRFVFVLPLFMTKYFKNTKDAVRVYLPFQRKLVV